MNCLPFLFALVALSQAAPEPLLGLLGLDLDIPILNTRLSIGGSKRAQGNANAAGNAAGAVQEKANAVGNAAGNAAGAVQQQANAAGNAARKCSWCSTTASQCRWQRCRKCSWCSTTASQCRHAPRCSG
ncbi:uncharacterized protein LOC119188479 isoform X2 [Manduca sexta]|uniref:uncharacterized protein LOC119188479 isoform X2 n=1 Tax=Manduca sexta TaxID=7130 RepID=UPI00189099D2|nr:uncharacterized protein LOC119188479 isoform X2 [Manduca sexta]